MSVEEDLEAITTSLRTMAKWLHEMNKWKEHKINKWSNPTALKDAMAEVLVIGSTLSWVITPPPVLMDTSPDGELAEDHPTSKKAHAEARLLRDLSTPSLVLSRGYNPWVPGRNLFMPSSHTKGHHQWLI